MKLNIDPTKLALEMFVSAMYALAVYCNRVLCTFSLETSHLAGYMGPMMANPGPTLGNTVISTSTDVIDEDQSLTANLGTPTSLCLRIRFYTCL